MSEVQDQPDWATILEFLYDEQCEQIVTGYKHDRENQVTQKEIRHHLGIELPEIKSSIQYMTKTGLLDIEDRSEGVYILTPDGFQVAHDRKMGEKSDIKEDRRIRSQNKINGTV